MIVRRSLERIVTKKDYFHLPHKAEAYCDEPTKSYYYDVRQRIYYPYGFENGLPVIRLDKLHHNNPVNAAQYGLGFLQNYWDSERNEYLQEAKKVADNLIKIGEENQKQIVWKYPIPMKGQINWLSAMAQGQAASLLLRIGVLYNDEYYYEKARKALTPFFKNLEKGGVATTLTNQVWFEEYGINPPPFTLNGYIVAILGIRDAAVILKESHYEKMWIDSCESLNSNLNLFDYHGWSKYCLSSKSLMGLTFRDLASPFYQRFHVELLKIMNALNPTERFQQYCKRWEKAILNEPIFYKAVAEKIVYRLIP